MENLFAEFDPVSKQEWLAKIEQDAKGKSLDSFNWQLGRGMTISPFIRKEDLSEIHSPIKRITNNNNWSIAERIFITAPAATNKQIITALESGASALIIEVGEALSQDVFSKIFKNVNFTYIKICFDCANVSLAEQVLQSVIDFCDNNKLDPAEVLGAVSIKDQLVSSGSELVNKYQSVLKKYSFAHVASDALYTYSETAVEEVVSLINGFTDILDSTVQHNVIDLNISVTKSYFLNIAKIRAIQILAQNICKAYQVSPTVNLNASIAANCITDNENQNLIQFTSQAMSAVIGGVNCVELPATDIKSSEGTDFRKRLSRNIQSIMQMESYMDKVVDPAAGSYYIESLTEKIASKSWAYLQAHS